MIFHSFFLFSPEKIKEKNGILLSHQYSQYIDKAGKSMSAIRVNPLW